MQSGMVASSHMIMGTRRRRCKAPLPQFLRPVLMLAILSCSCTITLSFLLSSPPPTVMDRHRHHHHHHQPATTYTSSPVSSSHISASISTRDNSSRRSQAASLAGVIMAATTTRDWNLTTSTFQSTSYVRYGVRRGCTGGDDLR